MLLNNIFNILKIKAFYICGWIKASLLGVKLSAHACVSPYANIRGAAYIGDAQIGSNVTIGRGSYINSGIIASGNIGEYCSIAYGCLIGPTEHRTDYWTTSPYEAMASGELSDNTTRHISPPTIKDRVWICANVIILRGVTIEEGAIIAAGSVVTKDVPGWEMWGGIPARRIKVLNKKIDL